MTKGRPFQELAINSSTALFQKESFSISSEVLTLHLVTERSFHFFALSEVLPVACGNKLVNGLLDMVPPAGTSVAQAPNGQQEAPAQQGFFGGGVGSILRMLAIFWMIKQFFGGGGGPPKSAVRTDYYWPKFNRSDSVDFYLYGSESAGFNDVTDTSNLIWSEANVPLATTPDLSKRYTYHPSKVHINLTA